MQETIPQLEEELERLVSDFVESATRARSPMIGEIPRHRVFEGGASAIIRPSGEKDDVNIREFSAASQIESHKILYSGLNELLESFLPVAESMANDHAKMFFEVMNEATKKTGNVVDGKGKPLSHEMILEILEQVEIDFDSDGNPLMPTMMISPAMAPRVQELINDPDAQKFEKKHKQIMDKKRLEWRDREANRTLVG